MEDLDDIDRMLATNAKHSILQDMGLQNLNTYLILDERQEEAKRIAANATPKKFSEMIDKLSETFTGGIRNAADLFDVTLEHLCVIPTGIQELDHLLHDGILSNKITEITGVSGAGKTRFCHKLILSMLAKTSYRVLYIDSGSSFSIERIEHYCNKYRMTKTPKEREILYSRVKHVTASKPKDLLFTLISLLENLEKGKIELSLVIIDCFSSIMNTNVELGEYEEYLTEVYKLIRVLNTAYFVGVLVTTTAKIPNIKSQKAKSILSTPWNFMPQTSLLIENMTNDNKADTQKGFYRITLLSSECLDDLPSLVVQMTMHPTSQRD